VAELADRRMREALAALASRTQPPAAGVACALAGAAAAALVELTAGLAADRVAAEGGDAPAGAEPRLRALADRAGEIRERLLEAADADAQAYAQVTGARGAAGRARALGRASDPPLAIAECAAEVAEAAAEIARAGSWAFSADAIVASRLAMAAAQGGAELVAANLAAHAGDPRTGRARAAADRAQRASAAAATPASN
jgi:formiminotetrahydrofolate cyclodeaminase